MRKFLLATLLVLSVSLMRAQTDSVRYNGLSSWRDNWYIELSAGGNVLFSKDARLNMNEKNVTPNITLAAGKWFSPFVGARLQLHGYSLAAGSSSLGMYIADPQPDGSFGSNDPVRDFVTVRPDGSYTYPVYYLHAHVDVTVSITNLIHRGMASSDRWDVIPAVGVGYMHVFNNKGVPSEDVMTANFSVMGKYRILPQLDVNIEAQSTLMPDVFEGRITGAVVDPMFSFSVGVTYNIFGHNFSGEYRMPERRKKVRRRTAGIGMDAVYALNERQAESDSVMLSRIEEMNRRLDNVESVPSVPNITVVRGENSAKELNGKVIGAILYRIGTTEPTSSPTPQLENVVAMLEAFPEARLIIEGYADSATGSDAFNMKLSQQRVDHAQRLLTGEYGIDAERIECHSHGGTSCPYSGGLDVQRAVIFRLVF